jgi:hypothetical protein
MVLVIFKSAICIRVKIYHIIDMLRSVNVTDDRSYLLHKNWIYKSFYG